MPAIVSKYRYVDTTGNRYLSSNIPHSQGDKCYKNRGKTHPRESSQDHIFCLCCGFYNNCNVNNSYVTAARIPNYFKVDTSRVWNDLGSKRGNVWGTSISFLNFLRRSRMHNLRNDNRNSLRDLSS